MEWADHFRGKAPLGLLTLGMAMKKVSGTGRGQALPFDFSRGTMKESKNSAFHSK